MLNSYCFSLISSKWFWTYFPLRSFYYHLYSSFTCSRNTPNSLQKSLISRTHLFFKIRMKSCFQTWYKSLIFLFLIYFKSHFAWAIKQNGYSNDSNMYVFPSHVLKWSEHAHWTQMSYLHSTHTAWTNSFEGGGQMSHSQ